MCDELENKAVTQAAPVSPRQMSAEEFHKSRGDLIIPLYAKLDENGQGRVPTKDEILSAIYKFAEAYADSVTLTPSSKEKI